VIEEIEPQRTSSTLSITLSNNQLLDLIQIAKNKDLSLNKLIEKILKEAVEK